MGIGLMIFTFVIATLACCAGAAYGVRHFVGLYRKAIREYRTDDRFRLQQLARVRASLIAGGSGVLLAGFIALPALFRHGASSQLGRVVPWIQIFAFAALLALSAWSEFVLRRPHGEGRALWRLFGRVTTLEIVGWSVALLTAAVVLLLPRWGLAHFGKLRFWDPYCVMPLSALAIALGLTARAFVRPIAIRRLFHAEPLPEEDAIAQAIRAAHGDFLFPAPRLHTLPADGTGRLTANRRGLFGRHLGWRRENVFVADELCSQLSPEELDALARREVAHGILHTAWRRLARTIAVAEALLAATWLYPKLQVPLAVSFGLDAHFVHLWVPVVMIAVCAWLALRGWFVAAEEDEQRADLYAVEVLGASVSALSHGLRKVFADTIGEGRSLDRRLAALDDSLRAPIPLPLLNFEEREAIALHRRRVAFGAVGGVMLVLIGWAVSPFGQRQVLQWRVAFAIHAHDAKQVSQLLARGASPNRENLFGVSPVSAAAGAGDLDMLRELVAHGGAVQNESWPKQPLNEAAAHGRIDVIAFLLQSGAQVNAKDFNGQTALMAAASNGKRETVAYLLDHGARLAMRDQTGRTALQLAEGRGDREIARVLRHAAAR